MLKRTMVLVTAVAALLVAFAPLVQAQAETSRFNERIPIEAGGVPLCGGETVNFSGEMHIQGHTTIDANGGLHGAFHSNYSGVEGVGETTGDRYTITDVANSTFNAPGPPPFEFTTTQTGRLIHQGEPTPADDTLFHLTLHMTVNANGDLTATVENINTDCM